MRHFRQQRKSIHCAISLQLLSDSAGLCAEGGRASSRDTARSLGQPPRQSQHGPRPDPSVQERRKIRRRIANRESARRVRAAKAEQMQVMNDKVGDCRHAEPADCSNGSGASPALDCKFAVTSAQQLPCCRAPVPLHMHFWPVTVTTLLVLLRVP